MDGEQIQREYQFDFQKKHSASKWFYHILDQSFKIQLLSRISTDNCVFCGFK